MSKVSAGSTIRKQEQAKRKLDAELDRELENTFPASDPPKIILAGSRTDISLQPDEDADADASKK